MKTIKMIFCPLLCSLMLFSCKEEKKEQPMPGQAQQIKKGSVTKSDYATTKDGTKIDKYTLINGKGMKMEVITYGGIITSLNAPDKNGRYEDIVLGYTTADDYLNGNPFFFGAIIGRYGNRIAKGKFSLDGKEYQLATNDGPNHLHGGKKGFDKVVWTAAAIEDRENPTLQLSYTSRDREEGYPGKLTVRVTYTLTDDNTLEIAYEAETDKKTIVNLTQHSYFNLSANFSTTILDHELMIKSGKMLPVDATLIPTGELKTVSGTAFDFSSPKEIGRDINKQDEQLKRGKGYDHCWIFEDKNSGIREVASVYHKASGRFMEVFTDQPGIQFYSGNFLDGTKAAKTGGMYQKRSGLCLETQHYPDSPNHPEFPSVVLNPGEKYTTKTVYKFSVK